MFLFDEEKRKIRLGYLLRCVFNRLKGTIVMEVKKKSYLGDKFYFYFCGGLDLVNKNNFLFSGCKFVVFVQHIFVCFFLLSKMMFGLLLSYTWQCAIFSILNGVCLSNDFTQTKQKQATTENRFWQK